MSPSLSIPQESSQGRPLVVIQIPSGSRIKYESRLSQGTRSFVIDRVIETMYPASYGCVAGTYSADGDEKDIFVIGTQGYVGQTIPLDELQPIAVVRLIDTGEEDDKLVYAVRGLPFKLLWEKLAAVVCFLKIYKKQMTCLKGSNKIAIQCVERPPGVQEYENPNFFQFCKEVGLPFMRYDPLSGTFIPE